MNKVINGSINVPFTYNVNESGNVSISLSEGDVTLPKYIAEKIELLKESGSGNVLIRYNVRLEKENGDFKVVRVPSGKDLGAGIGRPVEEVFKFFEAKKDFKRTNGDMMSDIFFDYNKKFDYKNLLLEVIENNIENGSLGEELKRRNAKEDWTEDEAEIALEAYFLSLDGDGDDIKDKAEEAISGYGLERTLAAMVMKILNYRHLDPLNDQTGLDKVGQVFKTTWASKSEEYRKKYKRKN